MPRWAMIDRLLRAGVLASVTAGILPAAEVAIADRHLTIPDDYTLEVVAAPPLVDRPIEASFDDRGRLYVTESSGSNEAPKDQLEKKPHRVLRLTDTNGDGVFDQRTVFADGLMFPEGCLWHQGSLYVAAPPQIWRLTDADDDGVAETREVWFDGKTLTGCANDLHGPYVGPDGMIYWCKGAFAEQTYDLPGQPGWKTRAAHVFRAPAGRPTAEGVEPVFTAGMDNPVGLAWTPEGDLIVAGTFLQRPDGGKRDGLIHAVWGGVWGKDHDVLEGHPRTGALMPAMTHLGPAAPCGIARYGRDLLVCQFNMHKVSRHVLRPEGASYRTEDSDFLGCDHPDFHPTDVLQAPDGSVLVLDTGGWYKLCCPTSQLAKPDVLGAIYRLRRRGGEVSTACPPPQWAAVAGTDVPGALAALASPNLHLRREAAAALGRARVREAVPALLTALAAPEVDRFLFHAGTYALLQIGDAPATRAGLDHASPVVRSAALYALEQMNDGGLKAADVLPPLAAADAALRDAALFALTRHREWAGDIDSWIREQLAGPDAGGESVHRVLLAFGGEAGIRDLIGRQLAATPSAAARRRLLGVMAELHPEPWPDGWRGPVEAALAAPNSADLDALLDVVASAPPETRAHFNNRLGVLAKQPGLAAAARLQALAAQKADALDDTAFAFVSTQLSEPATRTAAASLLSARQLTAPQLRRVAKAFGAAGVLERPLLLKTFAGQSDETAGLDLLAELEKAAALAALPPETLQDTFAKFPEPVQRALARAQAQTKAPDQAARLDELEKSLPAGVAAQGAVVFQSAKAACATCHPIGYKGGHVGPDLSAVGAVRTRRDLLEAVVFPSASFVRSYEPVQITKKDDSILYGIVTNQGGEALTVSTGAATPEARVPVGEIKSMTPGAFSLMPQGLDQILSAAELADLIAFLQSRK